jgi:hypothetical protein
MQSTISKLLAGVRLGEPKTDGGLTIIPMFGGFADAPKFITLTEALGAETLVVTEVDAGGSVPELRARNDGGLGVLILDGEELAGAKQNRVLNTSVFLKPGTEIPIPVSCVERGRWSSVSERFSDSGNVSAHAVRLAAHNSVTRNVRASTAYASDQGRVWAEVDALSDRHGVKSATCAMHDVYDQRRERMKEREAKFALQPGQVGVFALWGGKVVGFDIVATPEAYTHVHDRLVRSYTLDALAESVDAGKDDLRTAKEFLVSLADARPTRHPSPGDGSSRRYTGDGFAGSVLTVDHTIMHAVFFGADNQAEAGPSRYPSARQRRQRFEW